MPSFGHSFSFRWAISFSSCHRTLGLCGVASRRVLAQTFAQEEAGETPK